MSSELPYLNETSSIHFPPVSSATPEGIVAVGGNLSPGVLLSAYRQGIFPWFSEGDPILWWSPDPRCVLFPGELHVSRSMQKLLRKNRFRVSLDTGFSSVIDGCRTAPRRGQRGTWITGAMRDAYVELHELGFAHSVEVWDGGMLCGGMYGVSLGSCFFGESMFSRVQNASKIALIQFFRLMEERGIELLDCQVHSPHLESLGARQIPRREFMDLLRGCLEHKTMRGNWTHL
jgi:leucyl/phenylalanyl-tRNA--protein transferase